MLSIFSQIIFGNPNVFTGRQEVGLKDSIWKDKSLYFDLRSSDLEVKSGEHLIACFYPIEDVKGNPDELGVLKVTNLRIIWICGNKKRVNLSIGWQTVSLTFEQDLKSLLGTPMTSLYILCKYESTKYEFVFNRMLTYMNNENWGDFQELNRDAIVQLRKFCSPKCMIATHLTPMYLDNPFNVVFKVWQCYRQTQLFRNCRSNLTSILNSLNSHRDSGLKLEDINRLPDEEIMEIFSDIIQSESRSIKYNGKLLLTNIRLVWVDDSLPLRNISIPFIRISSIRMKQAIKIIITTLDYLAASTQVEFKVQEGSQSSNIKIIFDQIQNFYSLSKANPKFGPESCEECMNMMNHLRPVQSYLDYLDDPLILNDMSIQIQPVDLESNLPGNNHGKFEPDSNKLIRDNSLDESENQLNNYGSKLASYLNEQPIAKDKELIYIKEYRFKPIFPQEFGLAFERPNKDLDLNRIWRIHL